MRRFLPPHWTRQASALLLTVASVMAGCTSSSDQQVKVCEGHPVTIAGTLGDDRLVGTPGVDVIAGGPGSDRIFGGAGNDIICGGSGDDRLRGEAGDDELYGGDDRREVADTEYYEWYGDVLDGGPGDDRLDPGFDHGIGEETVVDRDRVTFSSSTTGVKVDLAAGTATGDGNDTLIGPVSSVRGSRHDDVLRGSRGDDILMGGLGADSIHGLAGNDEIGTGLIAASNPPASDRSANRAFGGAGDDIVYGSAGDEFLSGGAGRDALYGELGRDRVDGGAGPDAISENFVAGSGQWIDGGPGVDELMVFFIWNDPADAPLGEPSRAGGTLDLQREVLLGSTPSGPLVVPVRDIENASGSFGPWTMIGNDEDNQLIAGFDQTPLIVRAGGGKDRVMGSFKHDVLDGGPGRDVLLWSPGKDDVSNFEKVRR